MWGKGETREWEKARMIGRLVPGVTASYPYIQTFKFVQVYAG